MPGTMDSTSFIFRLSFICFVIGWCTGRTKLREVAYLYDFLPCSNFPVSSDFNASYVYGGKDDFKASLEFTVKKTYPTVEGLFECSKCPSREKTDCEMFLSFPIADYCAFESSEGDWKLILDQVNPPLKCPIKGHYSLKDFPISQAIPAIKKFLGIGLLTDTTIYYNRLVMKYKEENILCLEMMGSFRLMRV